MNATGDSDMRNYYDAVSAHQENDLRPEMAVTDEALIRHALGTRPEEIDYDWRPLWQPTDKELAEIAKMEAETTKIYAMNNLVDGFVLNTAVKNQLIERGNYPGIEQVFKELEDKKRDADRLATNAGTQVPEAQGGENSGSAGTGSAD